MSGTTHQSVCGFIVHALVQGNGRGGSRVAYIGRLADGRTFAAVIDPFSPRFFVRAGELPLLEAARGRASTDRTTTDGEAVVALEFGSVSALRDAAANYARARVRTYEADVSPTDAFLIDHRIHGTLRIEGAWVAGHAVDCVFMNPTVSPEEARVPLEVLSIDIETRPATGQILAISLVTNGAWNPRRAEVLFLGGSVDDESITSFASEREMLVEFVDRVRTIDPDVITGWNVIDFDLAAIADRLDHYRVPFLIARSAEPARFLASNRDEQGRRQNAGFSCQGRQALDGLRLVRYGPQRFDDRKLDSVAREVLGVGKTIGATTSAGKIEAIETLYRDDPKAFCDYCRKDAELVLGILDATGLLELTVRRGTLTGVGLARAWTSVLTFEFLYLEEMHARGMVAPTLGIDQLPLGEAPGGAILKPRPGVWNRVMVFDFKSLYPSLIRTFGIDPVGYRGTDEGYPEGVPPRYDSEAIVAPNGARFAREPAILPALLDRFWEQREQARAAGDEVARYVYKIVMNSFYGVLGTPGCRFAGAVLAGAITSFGQYFLHWTRSACVAAGLSVIYGDTDSLFVIDPAIETEACHARGREICARINSMLTGFIESAYGVESMLELEFETVYDRFYLPTVRHAVGVEARGRAKGYAGRPVSESGERGEIEIKGMEAIRSDWTVAAQELQRELLALLFDDAPPQTISACVERWIADLRAGALDARLTYSRRLRKGLETYTKNRPPHAQAALLLPEEEREGEIEYAITVDGPQPTSRLVAALDHAHYLERQLRPIAEPICELVGVDAAPLFDPASQLSLFT